MLWYGTTGTDGAAPFLIPTAILFGVSGVLALVLSRGRHPSWMFFLPIGALTGYAALA
jgi:hypothetical protein